jgi:hypothetical protein
VSVLCKEIINIVQSAVLRVYAKKSCGRVDDMKTNEEIVECLYLRHFKARKTDKNASSLP